MTDKIFLAEIADNVFWNDYLALYAHTWGVVTTNIYTDIVAPELEPELIGLDSDLNVLSYTVRKKQYLKVDTIAEVVATEGTFYYNTSNNLLLVHFEDNATPYHFSSTELEIGFTLGFYRSSGEVIGEWNDQPYYSRLIATPIIQKEKDDFFYSKQVYPDGKITFDNSDYKFRKFTVGRNVRSRAGSFVRILLWTGDLADGDPDYDDFVITYQGIVKTITEGNIIEVSLRDIRTSLNKKTPTNILDTGDFTDIKDPDTEYLIPQIWGKCYGVPCLSLDENINIGNGSGPWDDYRFMLCDASLTGYSTNDDDTVDVTIASDAIKAVYVDGVEITAIPTVSLDSTNGIYYFTLPYETFYKADDGGDASFNGQNKVSVDVEGYLDESLTFISNGLEIIREILYQNYSYTYTSTFYDTTTWASFETSAYKVGMYISKPDSVQKIIGEICNSQLGEFVWNENLKFSFNNDDFVSLSAEISKYELFDENYIPKIEHDTSEVLASFRVGTKKKWSVNDKELSYNWIVDSTNRDTALSDFNSEFQKDFETLLYDATDISAYQERIHFFGDIANNTISISVPWDYRTLDKGEYIAVEYDLPSAPFVGWVIIQTTRVSLNVEQWKVEIEGRIFEYGPYFALITEEEDYAITNEASDRSIIITDYGRLA